MRRITRILAAAVITGLVLCTEAFAVSAPVSGGSAVDTASLSLAEKAALAGKTLLAPPTYAYISDGMLYWGGQAENVGVSVEFYSVSGKNGNSVSAAASAGQSSGDTYSRELESTIVKTGNDPIDVTRILKNVELPYFRIRCIPEFHQRQKLAASEWLELDDIKVEMLQDLGLQGWIFLPGRLYYFENGKPHKGWLTLDRKEYYMDPETGVMQSGWFSKNDKWYYFQEGTGELLTDGMTPDGYEVDKAGAWTGRCADGRTFYLDVQ